MSEGGADKGKWEASLRVVKGYLTQDGEITFHDVKRPYQKEICGETEWNSDTVLLELKAEGQKNTFCATDADGEVSVLASDLDGGFLGSKPQADL